MKKWFSGKKVAFKLTLSISVIIVMSCLIVAGTTYIMAMGTLTDEIKSSMQQSAREEAQVVKRKAAVFYQRR